jgi:ADP-dependent NAD(P)H-hydrate dehydratase / NAD(P)H-hydrate epimerase
MKPVLTAAEMRTADDVAVRADGHDTLVERAGFATAIAAVRTLPTVYGARVAVLCGPGSNGEDGRVAARLLTARGATVAVHDATRPPSRIDGADLVIDAAFGTGLSRPWDAPEVGATPVLAVDIASGVDPDTGHAGGRSLRAVRTVAMQSLKRGHVQGDGASLSGTIDVADLGIDVGAHDVALVEDVDLARIPPLSRNDHKWRRAVVVLAGAPGMLGAPALACGGALCAQAGMILLCTPGVAREQDGPWPDEVVRVIAGADDLVKVVLGTLARARALVVGPGLGRSTDLAAALGEILAAVDVPVVLDADALHLVHADQLRSRQDGGGSPVILTPHDGEYEALLGAPPGEDRIAAAQQAAERVGCTVLVKGSTTVVASPRATQPALSTLVVMSGSPDLATPGSGDVLSGVVGALLARGLDPPLAAALGAHVHGRAGAALGAACRASALPAAISTVLAGRATLDEQV